MIVPEHHHQFNGRSLSKGRQLLFFLKTSVLKTQRQEIFINFLVVIYYNHAESTWKVVLRVSLFSVHLRTRTHIWHFTDAKNTHPTHTHTHTHTHTQTEDVCDFLLISLQWALYSSNFQMRYKFPIASPRSDVRFSHKILTKLRILLWKL